jgi:hypothetical protein
MSCAPSGGFGPHCLRPKKYKKTTEIKNQKQNPTVPHTDTIHPDRCSLLENRWTEICRLSMAWLVVVGLMASNIWFIYRDRETVGASHVIVERLATVVLIDPICPS